MKRWMILGSVVAAALLGAMRPAQSQAPMATRRPVTVFELDQLASRLLQASGRPFSGQIVAHPTQSGGFAAIRYVGHRSTIFVSPEKLSSRDLNTWAFVLGHEFGHQISGRGGTPQAESEADLIGAKMAIKAGYDVEKYVRHLLAAPESCAPTHGCFHARAHALARRHGVQVPASTAHAGHKSAPGLLGQPNTDVLRRLPTPLRVPCNHAVHPFDQAHAFDVDLFGNRLPCQHRAACTHRTHPYDLVQ